MAMSSGTTALGMRAPMARQISTQEAQATLNTMTRMVVDISYACNGECGTFDLEMSCPTVTHIMYCANQHISVAVEARDEKWHRDFESLKETLRFFEQRWPLAGTVPHYTLDKQQKL
jgi:hypothetical protein